jgi:hypothetical protein
MKVFRRVITLYKDMLLIVAALMAEFEELFVLEEALVHASPRSDITNLLKKADKRIDRVVVAIRSSIDVGLHHFDPIIVAAAEILDKRMHDFGTIPTKSYAEESAAVQLFIIDLQTTHAAQVLLLGLTPFVNELVLAEEAFTQLFDERTAELAARTEEKLRDVRTKIDKKYDEIIAVLESDTVRNGDALCGAFITEFNIDVEYYKVHDPHRVRLDLVHAVAASIPDQFYTGKPIIIIPEVHYVREGHPTVELQFSVDFTVTYKDNLNVGDADVILHGKGAYKGQKIVTFNIKRPV